MGGTICRSRDSEQIGRGLLPMPWFMVKSVLKAIADAEEMLGYPPTIMEIFVALKITQGSSWMLKDCYQVAAVIVTLLREDMVFVDKISYRWTVRKSEGYFSFSELFLKHYGSTDMYGTLKNGAIFANQARTINYS